MAVLEAASLTVDASDIVEAEVSVAAVGAGEGEILRVGGIVGGGRRRRGAEDEGEMKQTPSRAPSRPWIHNGQLRERHSRGSHLVRVRQTPTRQDGATASVLEAPCG